jgi:hypothetical protein
MSKEEKLEYAVELIEALNAEKDEPMIIAENVLQILEYGQITPRQMLDYIEATR